MQQQTSTSSTHNNESLSNSDGNINNINNSNRNSNSSNTTLPHNILINDNNSAPNASLCPITNSAPSSFRPKFVSANVQGMKNDHKCEEIVHAMSTQNIFAATLQETWRSGREQLSLRNYSFILNGPETQSGRGSTGVGIVLNPLALDAWKAASCELHNDLGPRIIAIRLCLPTVHSSSPIGIFLISCYAPISTDSEENWTSYYTNLSECISRKINSDLLVIGSDCNASIGIRNQNTDNLYIDSIGQHGLNKLNSSGQRLLNFLQQNNLSAVTTFFKKPMHRYITWVNPATKDIYQIDHFITLKSQLNFFTDAATCAEQLCQSDHSSIFCKTNIRNVKAQHPTEHAPNERSTLKKLDISPLDNPLQKRLFCESITNKIAQLQHQPGSSTSYSELATAVTETAKECFVKKQTPKNDWFNNSKSSILPLIKQRNIANRNFFFNRSTENKNMLRYTQKKVRKQIIKSKDRWLWNIAKQVNRGASHRNLNQSSWSAIKEIKKGFSKIKTSKTTFLRKPNGTLCNSSEENADTFLLHFESLYQKAPTYDPSSIDLITQYPIHSNADELPSLEELIAAIKKLNDTAPGPSGIQSKIWKTLFFDNFLLNEMLKIVHDFWINENTPDEWVTGILAILEKKGDLSNPNNYRGIMLLESFYKIVANIIHARLTPIAECLDNETQSGFRPGRSCMDAIFAVKMAIRKRAEHNQETWVLFLDLVKAFDRVPRELLWQVLAKSGVPPKLINLLKQLHSNCKVNFRIAELSRSFRSTIGVKQGDTLGPLLFIFFITAILHSWRKTTNVSPCIFKSTPMLHKLSGRRCSTQGDLFIFRDSAYADDTAALFPNNTETNIGVNELVNHFALFGMEVHTGHANKESKSKVLFAPKPTRQPNLQTPPNPTNNPPILVGNNCSIPVVDKFNYLGSIASSEATDKADVKARISTASNAFGALNKPVFKNPKISQNAKVALYLSLIISILLYGSECWVLTKADEDALSTFHNTCARAILKITKRQQRRRFISTHTILAKLKLPRLETLYTKHQLRWAGHLVRMNYSRMPRKFLNCWTSNRRPTGAPKMTYSRFLQKLLTRNNINPNHWHELAADRVAWKNIISNIH